MVGASRLYGYWRYKWHYKEYVKKVPYYWTNLASCQVHVLRNRPYKRFKSRAIFVSEK